MAEFHARPLEMDRKSGATSRIVPSQSSQHLFEKSPSDGVDDDDDDDKTIVFHGKLHRRIASTLQTKFHLTQPTHIQRQVLNVFAPQQSNLFVQSETGSGKTLAYLLPIVQVSRRLLFRLLPLESCLCSPFYVLEDDTLYFWLRTD